MSKNKEYSYPVMGMVATDEKGEVTLPHKKSKDGKGLLMVLEEPMKLPKVDKYSYKEINGKVYRVGEKGIEYPPITKAQFEEIKRLHEEYFGKDKEDGMEH